MLLLWIVHCHLDTEGYFILQRSPSKLFVSHYYQHGIHKKSDTVRSLNNWPNRVFCVKINLYKCLVIFPTNGPETWNKFYKSLLKEYSDNLSSDNIPRSHGLWVYRNYTLLRSHFPPSRYGSESDTVHGSSFSSGDTRLVYTL